MKCQKCGFEFEEGIFCPECGTKYTEEIIKVESAKEQRALNEDNAEPIVKRKKIPWYLSLPFVIIVALATMDLYGIPGIVLGVVRWKKYGASKKLKITLVIVILLALFYAMIMSGDSDTEEGNKVVENVDIEKEVETYEEKQTESEKEAETNSESTLEFSDALVRITYKKNSLSYNDDVILYIDGEKIGSMEAGEEETFSVILSVGTHTIQAKSDTLIRSNNSNKLEFDTKSGFQEIIFQLEDGSLGGLKISFEK